MPINDTTTNRGYQKPNIANTLSDDVGRLRSALDSIDTDMAAKAPTAGPTFTGVTTVAAGSAGAPSLTFTGATSDTGLYSPGTDQVSLCTGGVEKLRFDSFDGNPLIEITYPTVLPSLDLNFAATKRLDPRVTFSRSSSGTYYDAASVLQSAATNVARFDHNPSTGESLGLLVEESRTNVILYSGNLYLNTRTARAATIQPNADLAPDGTFTASKLIEDGSASRFREMDYTSGGISALGTGNITVSIFVKKAERDIIFFGNYNSTPSVWVAFNLTTKSFFTVDGYTQASSYGYQECANGWYRVWYSVNLTVNSTTRIDVITGLDQAFTSYTGDTSSGIYIWGQCVEKGSFPTSYIPTPATFTGRTSTATYYDANGVIQTALSGVARSNAYFPDSNGVMRSAGLLLEAAATNLVWPSNPTSGGRWNPLNGTTVQINQSTAPDGTTTASHISFTQIDSLLRHQFDVLAAGTVVTISFFAKAISGNTVVYCDLNDGTSNTINLTSSWKRFSFTVTNNRNPASPELDFNSASATATTIALWGVQIETNSFATSYIPTSGSTVTRSADTSTSATVTRSGDVVQMTGTNFSSWYRQDEGVIFAHIQRGGGNASKVFALANSASQTTNRIDTRSNNSIVNANSSTNIELGGEFSPSASNSNKIAVAYKAGSYAKALNSVITGTSSNNALPIGINRLLIGGIDNLDYSEMSAKISRLTYYPVRLSDTTLQTLTK